MRNLPMFLSGAAFCLASVAWAGDDAENLRKAVWAFESKLAGFPKGQEKERDQAIRDYFAGLKTSAHKIEAIGMMDSRYVYRIPRTMVSELLAPLIKDKDIEVRLRAAHALGYNGKSGDHFEAVVALAKAANDKQLQPIMYAMGRSHDERFLPHLKAWLKHPNGIVRATAVFELRSFADKAKDDVMALWDDPHEQVRHDLMYFCYPETKVNLALVQKRLSDPSSHVRTRALDYLGHCKDPEVPKVVAAMLADKHPHVRGKALEALGNLKAAQYRDEFVKRFQDKNEDLYVRRMAIRSFENLAQASHERMIRELSSDEDDQVRQHAKHILTVLEKARLLQQ